MRPETDLLEDTAEDLFEEAPCGYVSTRLDGTIVKVNRTFESWTGRSRSDLLTGLRFQDLLSPGGRIYHETHYAPLLQMQGSVREIAVDIVRADGSLLPALINSVLRRDTEGRARVIRTTIFDATDRRRYEQELLRASQREHDIAQQLQRSLLSGELPAGPGLELEIFYSPAIRGLAVGGDWYDAFWVRSEEAVGLVLGDVVGRGIAAAATMGQLRSAVRALASTGLEPAAMLEALDGYSRRHGVGEMTTLVYAELTLATGLVRFACAGHPPPLILEPGKEPYFAQGGRSPPLNPYGDPGHRAEACCTLGAGAVVLLYTDGLIEQRSAPHHDGALELRRELACHRDDPLKEMVQTVVHALRDSSHADDVCLLAAQLTAGSPAGLPEALDSQESSAVETFADRGDGATSRWDSSDPNGRLKDQQDLPPVAGAIIDAASQFFPSAPPPGPPMNERLRATGSISRLEIERLDDARGIELKLTGELDLETTPALDEQLARINGSPTRRWLVDLGGVEFMDSTGLAAIVRAQRAATSNGHTLSLRRATGQVRRLFDLTGMTERLSFED